MNTKEYFYKVKIFVNMSYIYTIILLNKRTDYTI